MKITTYLCFVTAALLWIVSKHEHLPPDRIAALSRTSTPTVRPCLVGAISLAMTRGKASPSKSYSSTTLLYLSLVLFEASWDIETNPGPDPTIYPCGVCTQPVTFTSGWSVCCDSCDIWSHKDCLGMTTTLFEHLKKPDVMWISPTCDMPNYSGVLYNAPIADSSDNYYSVLANSMSLLNSRHLSIDSDMPVPASFSTPSFSSTRYSDIVTPPHREDMSSCSDPIGSPINASSPKPLIYQPKRNKLTDNFKIAVINFQSIRNKVMELGTFLDVTEPDIVLGTESWLKPEINNSEIFPPGYTVHRRDRQSGIKKSGGGVFILVKNEYTSTAVGLDTDCELVFAKLELKDQQDVCIGCFYRPPWADEKYMQGFTNALDTINPNRDGNLWIGGDFNLPKVDWQNMCSTTNNSLEDQLIECANDHSLTQVIDGATRGNNLLDLFFTTTPSLVNRSGCIPPLAEADHEIVFVDVNTRANIPKRSPGKRYLYHKADWDSMADECQNYTVPEGNTQSMWDSLENFLKSLVEKHVPSCPAKPQKQKPWVTSELKALFNKRDRLHRKARATKSEKHKNSFLDLRHQAQKAERSAYKQYTDSIFGLGDVNTQDPTERQSICKRFWSYIKSRRKDSCGIAPLKSEGTLISDAKGKAGVLNKQYCSVFTNEDPVAELPQMGPSPHNAAPDIHVTVKGVEKLLLGLNPNKASVPDRISPQLLKNLATHLAAPLAQIFQTSISEGQVPYQWRTALVSPIFKKGDRHQAANYRPVSLTAVCCKLCEHIVSKSVLEHFEDNGILTDSQHGFRPKRSCETQLLSFMDELFQSVSGGQPSRRRRAGLQQSF